MALYFFKSSSSPLPFSQQVCCRDTGGTAAIKNCLIMELALFACKYRNHKWWKLNPENSPDPDTVTASTWLLHMPSKVPSALSQNQVRNAEAIPAIWKHRLSYCRADKSIIYTLPVSATSAEKEHVVLSILLKRTFLFSVHVTLEVVTVEEI